MKFHDDKSDLYPLKGFLKCPEHNNSLTAYACRSHTGRLHHYYLCCKDKCNQRYRIQDVHESIEDILSTVSASAQIVNLYRKTLEKLFEKDDYNVRDEIQKMKKELEKLETRKSNLQNDLMDRTITSQDYQDMKGRVDKDIVLVKDNLIELQQAIPPFKVYLQNEVPMLENLMDYYRKSDGVTKKKILNSIFAEKLIVINGKVTEPIFREPIKLILRISKFIANSKGNKEVNIDFKLLQSFQS